LRPVSSCPLGTCPGTFPAIFFGPRCMRVAWVGSFRLPDFFAGSSHLWPPAICDNLSVFPSTCLRDSVFRPPHELILLSFFFEESGTRQFLALQAPGVLISFRSICDPVQKRPPKQQISTFLIPRSVLASFARDCSCSRSFPFLWNRNPVRRAPLALSLVSRRLLYLPSVQNRL